MAVLLQPTSRKTTILDLNDDCLKEVFADIDPKTLTTVADVCTRFKRNTMHAALLRIKEIHLSGDLSVYEYSMLRNFGEFIGGIRVDLGIEKRIFQYLSSYCVGKSIELQCYGSRMTGEIAILMRPLLGRVEKLQLTFCNFDEVVLRDLPLWSAGLQEPEYGASKSVNVHEKQIDHLGQKNLKSITFWCVPDVKNAHIEDLLKQNPQLKEIGLFSCNSLDDSVLESIARNVPTIEKIGFVMHPKNRPSNRDNTKHFLHLHELKSLDLEVIRDGSYVQSVVHEIASVNTCLDHLDLRHFDLRHNANQFIGGISKLKQLKTLRLRDVKNFTADHLIEICKHAKELSVINLRFIKTMTITNDDLLEIVKNAKKLQEFRWSGDFLRNRVIRTNIDDNTFLKLAKLVDQRNETTNLCFYLPPRFFTSTISADLSTAVNNLKIILWY